MVEWILTCVRCGYEYKDYEGDKLPLCPRCADRLTQYMGGKPHSSEQTARDEK